MHYAKVLVLVVFLLGVSSVARAMDVYEWRTIAKGGCNNSIGVLGNAIRHAMQGGRPIDGVLERVKAVKDIIPAVKANFFIYDRNSGEAEYLLDDTGIQIVIKTVVKQFFADERLVSVFGNIPAHFKAIEVCTKEVLRYDPDGKKATAYGKISKAKNEVNRAKAQAEEEKEEEARVKAVEAYEQMVILGKEQAKLEQKHRDEKREADRTESYRKSEEESEARMDAARQSNIDRQAANAGVLKRQQEDNERSAKSSADHAAAIAKQNEDLKKEEEKRIKDNSGLKGFFKGIL